MSASSKSSWKNGVVHWFDTESGEGMIRANDGTTYYVHSSAIDDFVSAKKQKTKSLKDNQQVKFQLIEDTTFAQVSRVKGI